MPFKINYMKLELPYLINIPPFMLKGLEGKKIPFLTKVYLLLKGKMVSLIIKKYLAWILSGEASTKN